MEFQDEILKVYAQEEDMDADEKADELDEESSADDAVDDDETEEEEDDDLESDI